MPAGPAGMLVGTEVRRESFRDDRDPRLDGTIDFVDYEGEFVSAYIRCRGLESNAGRRRGSRDDVIVRGAAAPCSRFTRCAVGGCATRTSTILATPRLARFAFGWRPIDQVLLRGSFSTAFRAPNLITINEDFIARSNTRNDWVVFYAVNEAGVPAR